MKKKVKFLKDHVNNIKKGDVGEFNEARADYLVRYKIAKYVDEKPKSEPLKTVAKPKGRLKKAVDEGPCKTC